MRETLKNAGVTVAEVARRAGYSRSAVSLMLNGHRQVAAAVRTAARELAREGEARTLTRASSIALAHNQGDLALSLLTLARELAMIGGRDTT